MKRVHVLMLTTSSTASSCLLPFSTTLHYIRKYVQLAILDEAQQGLDGTDAWIFTLCGPKALLLLIGDQAQPAGASNVPLLQNLPKTMIALRPGLHSQLLSVKTPAKYLNSLKAVNGTGQPLQLTDFRALLGHLIKSCQVEFSNSSESLIGFTEPGALMLPISARVPEITYQVCASLAYSAQLVRSRQEPLNRAHLPFAPQTTDIVTIGLPCALNSLPPSMRGVNTLLSLEDNIGTTPTITQLCHGVDNRFNALVRDLSETDHLGMHQPPLKLSGLRYGPYIIPYYDRDASSSSEPSRARQNARDAFRESSQPLLC